MRPEPNGSGVPKALRGTSDVYTPSPTSYDAMVAPSTVGNASSNVLKPLNNGFDPSFALPISSSIQKDETC